MIQKLSIRTKLLGLIFFVSFVALTLLLFQSYQAVKAFKEGKMALVKTATERLTDSIDRIISRRHAEVQGFALSEAAQSGEPERIQRMMNDTINAYNPIYDLMIATNLKGRVIAANTIDKTGKSIATLDLIGKDYSNTNWFKAAANGHIKPGTALVEDVTIDRDVAQALKNSGKTMNFTAPIRNATGTILGVWSTRMSWQDAVGVITREESERLKSERIPFAFAYIVDKHGIFLSHPENSDYELTKTKENFLSRSGNTIPDTLLSEVRLPLYSGTVIEAVAASRGYGNFSGLGWSTVLQVPANDSEMHTYTLLTIGIAGILIILVVGVAMFTVRRISLTLEEVITKLGHESHTLENTASEIFSTSDELANTSTLQASSVQETTSSVEEIKTMLSKSTENSDRLQKVAHESYQVASRGKQSISQMIHSIEEINHSNEKIMRQIDHSNDKITELVKVISEIGDKTKIINDIVFQTKLLSFNASVEAARAGEHGKGFAVVAEEVGNLAQMSGNAAKEISSMLSDSMHKVDHIVNETKTKVERLVSEGKTKVENGTVIAKQCGSVLEEIVKNVSEVNVMIGEITTASQEQSQGVTEISKAMNQLDQVTHKHATVTHQSAASAKELSAQADSLRSLVGTLETAVRGTRISKTSETVVVGKAPKKGLFARGNIIPFRSPKKEESKTEAASSPAPKAIAQEVPSHEDPRFVEI